MLGFVRRFFMRALYIYSAGWDNVAPDGSPLVIRQSPGLLWDLGRCHT